MSRYVAPKDIERVYRELVLYYRELENTTKSKTTTKGELKRSSLRVVRRNSLPLSPTANISLSYDNEKEEVVLLPKIASSSILKATIDSLILSPVESAPPSSAIAPKIQEATPTVDINYANTSRGPKNTLPKIRRTLSGSFASLRDVFDKK